MRRLTTLGLVIAAAAITVAAAPSLVITTESLPPAVLGQQYQPFTLATAGDPGPIAWSIVGGNPDGFGVGADISGQSILNGTFCYAGPPNCSPSVVNPPSGAFTFTVQATSLSTNFSATKQFTLLVINPLQIVTQILPNAFANQTYFAQLQANGGTGQFSWTVLSGNLPPGITLDAASGTFAGKAPAVNGTFTFIVQLLDQVTLTRVNQQYTITVVGGVVNVSITTTVLPDATFNQAYIFQLMGSPVGQPMVWSVNPTTPLPTGFALSADGLLTGTGNTLGVAPPFEVQLTNPQVAGTLARQLLTLKTTLGPLNILETSLPRGVQNVPYTPVPLTPQGGIPPYAFNSTSLPPGITIDTKGVISGTPTTVGSFPVTITLTDCIVPANPLFPCAQTKFTQAYTLLIITGAVTITKTSLLPDVPGTPYVESLTASGGQTPYTWTVSVGSLPAGLILNSITGLITGTPTSPAGSQFTIKVTDALGTTASQVFTIAPALAITTASLPGATLNQAYSQTLAAIGGTPPLTWAVVGSLPVGLALNPSTGVIGGTPTVVGNSTFDVTVTDSGTNVARKTFTISVANSPVTVTSGDFTGAVLTAFSQTLTATGGTPPYTWAVTSGTLPGGLQLDSSTGVISGTPAVGETRAIGVTATDTKGVTGTKTINITINLPPAPVTSISLGTTTQPAVSLVLAAPYPQEITGRLTLTFASSVGGTDGGESRFTDGTRSLQYIVRPNTTQAIFPTTANPALATGTVAGTITLTANLNAAGQDITPSPAPTKTITIDPAVPVIASVTLQQVTGGLNVVVSGFSNTRELSSGSFTFSVSSGNTLSQAQITVQLTSAFATWFNSTSSSATGGQFKLTVPFTVTGNATAVTKVSVTLTNSKGTSAAVSSP